MAENNPYCRPSLMPRGGTSFYGGTPRAESRYDRGNLGPPVYGEYRDRWTGTEWLRGDGSRAPLAGLGEMADDIRAARAAKRAAIPFVATDMKIDGRGFFEAQAAAEQAAVAARIAAARAAAAPSFLEHYGWHLGIGVAALGVGYLLLRGK